MIETFLEADMGSSRVLQNVGTIVRRIYSREQSVMYVQYLSVQLPQSVESGGRNKLGQPSGAYAGMGLESGR